MESKDIESIQFLMNDIEAQKLDWIDAWFELKKALEFRLKKEEEKK